MNRYYANPSLMNALVASRLYSLEMDMAIGVQSLDEAVCISQSALKRGESNYSPSYDE